MVTIDLLRYFKVFKGIKLLLQLIISKDSKLETSSPNILSLKDPLKEQDQGQLGFKEQLLLQFLVKINLRLGCFSYFGRYL